MGLEILAPPVRKEQSDILGTGVSTYLCGRFIWNWIMFLLQIKVLRVRALALAAGGFPQQKQVLCHFVFSRQGRMADPSTRLLVGVVR